MIQSFNSPYSLSLDQHYGKHVISIHFKYDELLVTDVKRIIGIRYSSSRKMWYLPAELTFMKRIPNDMAIDISPDLILYTQGKYDLPEISVSPSLQEGALDTTLAMSSNPFEGVPFPDKEPWTSKVKKTSKVQKPTALNSIVSHDLTIDSYWLDKLIDYETWLKGKRFAPSTIKSYLTILKLYFVWVTKEKIGQDITLTDINRFNDEYFIKGNYSISYQNIWVNALKQFLDKYGEYTLDIHQVERPRKEKRLPNILSEKEVKQLINSYSNLKHKCLIMMLYACGLRKSEVINLKINAIDSDRKVIRIRQSKGAKDRDVALPSSLLNMLKKYFALYQPTLYLFNGAVKGKPISNSTVSKILKKGLAKSGVTKNITPHSLRHSYATHLVERNVNLRYIQESLGHKSSKTTEIYTKLSKDEIGNMVSPVDFWGNEE